MKIPSVLVSDPIADMLARIRNASNAEHETVHIPLSRQKVEIARILKAEGYVREYEIVDGPGGHRLLRVQLKYGPDRAKAISGLRRVSRPGRRVYAKAGSLPKVLGGMGTAILSTSRGLVTDRDARRANLGGEVIAYIW